jgi:integrase
VNIRRVNWRAGQHRWVVDWRADGKRNRRFFLSKKTADYFVADKTKEQKQLGDELASLNVIERAELIWLRAQMQRSRITARQLWKTYEQSLQPDARPVQTVTLSAAIEALIEAKRQTNRRPTYIAGLQAYLRLFSAGREEQSIQSLTPESIEGWFEARGEKGEVMNGNLGRLGSLFQFAWRKRWIAENPCRRVERATVERKPAELLSLRSVARLLTAARVRFPRALPELVLMIFAGVRPFETRRLTWDAVDLDRACVTIDSAASKVRERRIVALSPNAVEWLRWSKANGGKLPAAMGPGRLQRVKDAAGIKKWPQDVCRHTAVSYWLERDKNASAVAMSMGNSVQVIFTHYHNLVTERQCRLFWKIRPPRRCPARHGRA